MRSVIPKEEVRDRILDGAEALLARYGYSRTTVEDVAREVGIGKGSIYLHFPSKEEVFLSTVDRIVDRLKVRLSAQVDAAGPLDARLIDMLILRVMFRFDSVSGYSEGLNDLFAALRPAFFARRERYFAEEAAIFATLLDQGQRSSLLVPLDPPDTATTLLVATNALLPYSLNTRELGQRAEVERRITRLAQLLIRGLLQSPMSLSDAQ